MADLAARRRAGGDPDHHGARPEALARRPGRTAATGRRSSSRSSATACSRALTGLVVIQPFFLPLATGLFAGDSIAGEAQGGTLRYLLVRPVPRSRLVLAKYASAMTLLATMLALVAVSGIVAGGIVFGLHPLVTLSGTTLTMSASVLRLLATAGYMVLAVSGLAALGVFISTLTDSGPGAAVATIILAITSEILDNISSLHAIHGLLPTHGWQAFIGLFRTPVDWVRCATGSRSAWRTP